MEEKELAEMIRNDPAYILGWNDALEYSARWIKEAGDDKNITVDEFSKLNAMSLRAAKEAIKQQDFYDALKLDPDINAKQQEEIEYLKGRLEKILLKACNATKGIMESDVTGTFIQIQSLATYGNMPRAERR